MFAYICGARSFRGQPNSLLVRFWQNTLYRHSPGVRPPLLPAFLSTWTRGKDLESLNLNSQFYIEAAHFHHGQTAAVLRTDSANTGGRLIQTAGPFAYSSIHASVVSTIELGYLRYLPTLPYLKPKHTKLPCSALLLFAAQQRDTPQLELLATSACNCSSFPLVGWQFRK